MLELFEKAEKRNKEINPRHFCDDIVAQELCVEYKNIPYDIMQWFFVRDASEGKRILRDLIPIDAHKLIVHTVSLSNKELQNRNIIDYAPFASSEDDPVFYDLPLRTNLEKEYKDKMFSIGTWNAPIITLKQSNKLLVIDGVTRYSFMLIALKNKFKFIQDSHKVYVFEKDDG